jgi:hypothetical protein
MDAKIKIKTFSADKKKHNRNTVQKVLQVYSNLLTVSAILMFANKNVKNKNAFRNTFKSSLQVNKPS